MAMTLDQSVCLNTTFLFERTELKINMDFFGLKNAISPKSQAEGRKLCSHLLLASKVLTWLKLFDYGIVMKLKQRGGSHTDILG